MASLHLHTAPQPNYTANDYQEDSLSDDGTEATEIGYFEAVELQNEEEQNFETIVYESGTFITEKDYETFNENGDDLHKCIAAFQNDMPNYLRRRWMDKYEPAIASFECAENPIEKFNEIIGYPSWGSDAILDDLFTAVPDEDFQLLSDDTFTIFGYLYDIQQATEISDDHC
jgi:hypothetical protein